jgi:hypothetical protein
MLIDAAIHSSSFFETPRVPPTVLSSARGVTLLCHHRGAPNVRIFLLFLEKCAEILRQKILNKKMYTSFFVFTRKKALDLDKALT